MTTQEAEQPCCDSDKTHGEECWWDALDATAEDGDDSESPNGPHIERACAWQREHCARRPA